MLGFKRAKSENDIEVKEEGEDKELSTAKLMREFKDTDEEKIKVVGCNSIKGSFEIWIL